MMETDDSEDTSRTKKELNSICQKLKTKNPGTPFKASYLNRFTNFGGSSRKHEILIDFLSQRGIDVKKAKTVVGGFSERKLVYRALAELVDCERFSGVFLELSQLDSLAQRGRIRKMRTLSDRIPEGVIDAIRHQRKELQRSLRQKFLEMFKEEILPEFHEVELEGDPEVYIQQREFQEKEYFVVTFNFPRERRMSVWKHRRQVLPVPEYVTLWIDNHGEVTLAENTLHHRIFPHLKVILSEVFSITSSKPVTLSSKSEAVRNVIAKGREGKEPLKRVEFAGKDDRKIGRLIIEGDSVLEKLGEIIGDDALDKLLSQLELRFVQDERAYVLE